MQNQGSSVDHIEVQHVRRLRSAANDRTPVSGFTHCFYKYPARFSPTIVGSAIDAFSKPGDTVLDPYMGGGTTMVEALARGRHAIGTDINSLALFVTRAKTARLAPAEQNIVREWARSTLDFSYHTISDEAAEMVCPVRTKNLSLPRARPAKKFIAQAMLALTDLPNTRSQDFARCVLLNVAQWALNNRRSAPSLAKIRERVVTTAEEMLEGLCEFERSRAASNALRARLTLIHGSAALLPSFKPFANGVKANLVVTSPPYPGIHILYHRWQVDGRKETPAPYWIADCKDGKSSSFYNFADRRQEDQEQYFAESLRTLQAVRSVVADNAVMVQMIAFSRPRTQLPRYLLNMAQAGFREIRDAKIENGLARFQRIWRDVPGRAWHAAMKGQTSSAREVVLIHRAT